MGLKPDQTQSETLNPTVGVKCGDPGMIPLWKLMKHSFLDPESPYRHSSVCILFSIHNRSVAGGGPEFVPGVQQSENS